MTFKNPILVLMLAMLSLLFTGPSNGYASSYGSESAGDTIKEVWKVNDKIYVVDYKGKTIYNDSNSFFDAKQYEAYEPERFEVVDWQIVKDTIKASLSKERLQKDANKAFGLIINCDYEGYIQTIKFLFPKDIFLTLEELEKIESNFKSRKFQIAEHAKKGKDGIQLGIPCRLRAFLK